MICLIDLRKYLNECNTMKQNVFFRGVKIEKRLYICNCKGRVGVGLSLSEPTNLKHCQYLPHLPYTYLQ